jgi:hypothetical protein
VRARGRALRRRYGRAATDWKPPPGWNLNAGVALGPAITAKEIRIGDVPVLWNKNVGYGGLHGHPVDRVGPRNVILHTPYTRYTNAGEVTTTLEHKVPRTDVALVERAGVVHPVSDSAWAYAQHTRW